MHSNNTTTFLELVKLPPYTQQTFCTIRSIDSQTIPTEAKQLTMINLTEMYAQFLRKLSVCQAHTYYEGNKLLLLVRHAPMRIKAMTHSLETLFFFCCASTHFGSWPPLMGLGDRNAWTHHTRYDSSGRVISPTQ